MEKGIGMEAKFTIPGRAIPKARPRVTRAGYLRCSGKIYSEEYRQRFETKNVIFKIERSPINKNKLMLTINQQPISEWFKEQWEKLQQHLRNSVQKEQKSKGFRM